MRTGWSSTAINCFIGSVNRNGISPTSGRLAGIKIAVKDNICTKEWPTTCASAILTEFRPAYNATVVDLLAQEGAYLVGKANCDEFGMGSSNIHSHYNPVINPWDDKEQRSAGGSSGGSAAAIAAGHCIGALGTDTGGSTRLPAAYCGIVGFKPSYGLLSRYGVVAYADSLDCVGVMSKQVDKARDIFSVLNQYDPKDPTAATSEQRLQARILASECQFDKNTGMKGLRIGVPSEYFPIELEPQVKINFRKVVDSLSRAGAELVPISLPSTRYALSAYYIISSAEASSNLARYSGGNYNVEYGNLHPPTSSIHAIRTSKFGAEVKRRLLLGTYALMADTFDNYFLQAKKVAHSIQNEFNKPEPILNSNGVHFLLHPSAIRTAPLLDEIGGDLEVTDTYEQDILTVPASLAGLPAISLPSGCGDDGWPLGISVVGQWGTDGMLLDVAESIEKSLNTG